LETDPLGKDAHEHGSKLDSGKSQVVRYVLRYFPHALEAVARVSEYGATKYTEMGWRSVPDGYVRYSEALGRHLLASPDTLDVSGLDHDAQIAWNALARLEIKLVDGVGTSSNV
jgi:hypothetical protein